MTDSNEQPVKKKEKSQLKKGWKFIILLLFWVMVLAPFAGIYTMLEIAREDGLPSFEELENPQSSLASAVYSSDGHVLGRYFKENRTHISFDKIPKNLINALISTEDERYWEHSGIDFRALMRVAKGVVTGNDSQGGGSTISQQLAKLLFPREKLTKWGLVKRKFKEWIIASRLEKNYTKEEILNMYLNKFDFVNNAVGIKSAAEVYFGVSVDSLRIEQSAMLVGMAKNPSLFNPIRRLDTTMHRRNVVLGQMKKNGFITESEFKLLKEEPAGLNFTKVDHQDGLAPYFREILRERLGKLLRKKNGEKYVYSKPDGSPYDLYSDGLKIYTSIDSRLQAYAEWAMKEHLGTELQKAFHRNIRKTKYWPFSDDLRAGQADTIVNSAIKSSKSYRTMVGRICPNCERPKKYLTFEGDQFTCSICNHTARIHSQEEVDKVFNTPRKMKVFSWKNTANSIDTILTPRDSILYYKSFLRSGLISIDPRNGFIRAWVGGANFKNFKYDAVFKTKRQVGSLFKPLVYATAIRDQIFHPCHEFPNIEYCIEIPHVDLESKMWCPQNAGEKYDGVLTPMKYALAASMNNITAKIIKEVKPANVVQLAEDLGIPKGSLQEVYSLALGVCDLSLYHMTGAMSAFANKGIYVEPTFIVRIEDKDGNIVKDVDPYTNEALSEEAAHVMLELMKGTTRGVVHPYKKRGDKGYVGGTALRIRGSNRPYGGIRYPIAGKTGTTQNQSDGWFLGLTPDLVTGVWVGAEDRSVRFNSLRLGMGTNMALPIWGYYMNKVYKDSTILISKGDFEAPDSEKIIELDCNKYKSKSKKEEQPNFVEEDEWDEL